MKTKKQVKARIASSQNSNNSKKETEKKVVPLARKIVHWALVTVGAAILTGIGTGLLSRCDNTISRNFPTAPSLYVSESSFVSNVFFLAKNSSNDEGDFQIVVPTGEYGCLSMWLTNNDKATLTVNDIHFILEDYKPLLDVATTPIPGRGGYSQPVIYGVKIDEKLSDEYKCTLFPSWEELDVFLHSDSDSYDTLHNSTCEQIDSDKCDEIQIYVSPAKAGIYKFKIGLNYSIGRSNKNIETDVFSFAALSKAEVLFTENKFSVYEQIEWGSRNLYNRVFS